MKLYERLSDGSDAEISTWFVYDNERRSQNNCDFPHRTHLNLRHVHLTSSFSTTTIPRSPQRIELTDSEATSDTDYKARDLESAQLGEVRARVLVFVRCCTTFEGSVRG